MIVEIILTKFIGCKVFYHFINLIITTVILSFGAAGTFLYLNRNRNSSNDSKQWQDCGREAAIYSILLVLSVILFCWLPLDPYNLNLDPILRVSSLALYFVIFAGPFFFAGLCISRVLSNSSIPATRVYFFDLVAAALGAALTPPALDWIGGYGAVFAAAVLGFVAYLAFQKASGQPLMPRTTAIWFVCFAATSSLLFVYPDWALKKYGFDIRSQKEFKLRDAIIAEFHGLGQTYWNALARIDVSKTAWTRNWVLTYGAVQKPDRPLMEGRLVIVDGSAPTRQFACNGPLEKQPFFNEVLWASPYILNPDVKDALVIGGGGGIDIIVAKYFKIPNVTVLELNPSTYKHVLLGQGDPEAAHYQPWLLGTDKTKVTILNKEARHFSSMQQPASYDVIQASGVDTLTAVSSGALVNSDNYLYTIDAIRSYYRLLKPNGTLSLTHWRFLPPQLGLRMFVTYLEFLDEIGNKTPWQNVVVTGNSYTDTILKTTPFTEPELQRIRAWCKSTGNTLVFDPGNTDTAGLADGSDEGAIYRKLAFAAPAERRKIMDAYPYKLTPVTDDKPYFYQNARAQGLVGSFRWVGETMLAVYLTLALALILSLAPVLVSRSVKVSKSSIPHLFFFALSGFAFLLFEVAVIQLFSIFVGGPTYSLAVVLVAVLAGYSVGCFIANTLPLRPLTFWAAGGSLVLLLALGYFFLPSTLLYLMPLPWASRIVCCVILTFIVSVLTGIPVSLGMEAIKRTEGNVVSWMWAVSSAFNALGSATYVFISQTTGISATLVVSAVFYLLATIIFACFGPLQRKLKEASANPIDKANSVE